MKEEGMKKERKKGKRMKKEVRKEERRTEKVLALARPTEIHMLRSSIRVVMASLPRRASLVITLDDCMIGSSTF